MVPRRFASAAAARRLLMRIRFPPLFALAATVSLGACTGGAGGAAALTPQSKAPAASAAATVATSPPSATAPTEAASTRAAPGWLGVELAKRDGAQPGVLIRSVMRASPAERGGLVDGDVVTSINGQNVSGPSELRAHVMQAQAGARVSLGVLRGAETRLFAVELEAAPNDDELMRKNYVGSRAPDFGSLDTVQGSIMPSLLGLKGRVVVLEFWASWCGVCHVMAPTLNDWNDRYAAQGLTVLGVTNDPVDVAGRTAGQLGMGYALASDTTGKMLRAYRAYALPTLFVIDKQGNVRDVLIGYSTPRLHEIEALVRKLIAEG